MKRQEIGIVTGKLPQLSVFKTVSVLTGVVFLVMIGWMIWVNNKFDKCVAELKADPDIESWTDEQKDAGLKKCMRTTTP